MSKILKDNDGFTMMEFVVALAIMGVLMSIAIPSYNNVAEKTQAARNLANMEVIREVFFQYITGLINKEVNMPIFHLLL